MPRQSFTKLRRTFKKLSLKTRLLLAATLWLSAMTIAAGVSIPGLVRDYLIDDLKIQLGHTLDEITANLEVNKDGELVVEARLSDPRFNRPYSGLYWQVSHQGDTLRSRSLWDRTLTKEGKDKKAHYFGAKEEKLVTVERTLFLPDLSEGVTVIIGQEEDPIDDALESLTGQLWVILGVMVLGILLLIMGQVSWSLRPLAKMQRELKQLRSAKQHSLDEHYPKEIAPLVKDLNALLFHYQELLERARHHAGNLSHALKTPLSVLKNELESLSAEDRAKLEPQIAQIQAQIDYHLGRARMAGAMNILAVKSSPSERVDAISLAFDKVYAERDIALISELDTDLEVAVEKADLDEMLGNLLENAYKWGNSLIRVHSNDIDDSEVELIIEDDGPGIPAEQCREVTKRGVRLDESTPGTGLGLNIVSEMAHSYRGQLELGESKMGGLRAVLKLKRAKGEK